MKIIKEIKEYLLMHLRQVIIITVLIIVIGVMGFSKYIYNPSSTGQMTRVDSGQKGAAASSSSMSTGKVCVDIKGAVKRPGVYHLKKGSRVEEALAAAGGNTNDADLKQVNLAKELVDQQIVQIPKFGEQLASSPTSAISNGGNDASTDQDKVNLNTASKDDLIKIDGVGDKKADKILEYRNQKGGFKSPDDLKNISGFGEKTVAKLKDRLAV